MAGVERRRRDTAHPFRPLWLCLRLRQVGLPFSLIAPPGAGAALVPGLSLAINELTPGWMLADNAYAVHRRCAEGGFAG